MMLKARVVCGSSWYCQWLQTVLRTSQYRGVPLVALGSVSFTNTFAGLRAVLFHVQQPSHSRLLRTVLGVETLFLYAIDRLGAFGDYRGTWINFQWVCDLSPFFDSVCA